MLFHEGATKLGHPLKTMRRNTEGCEGNSKCNFGCPKGAKRSVDLSWLPKATARGAEVWTHCLVERVTHADGRANGVVGHLLNGDEGGRGTAFTVHAKRVVLAAGAYHTPLLAQASGIGKASGQVGRNLTLHPGFRVMGRFEEKVEGWRGALQSMYADDWEPEGITMTSLFLPPGVLAATMPGIGPKHLARAQTVGHLGAFGGMVHDEGGGVVRRGPGREPFVTYRMHEKDKAVVPKLMRLMADIWFAAGAKEVFLPVLGLYHLALLLPCAGMGARRLQDIGRDGKLIWIFIFAAFVSQLTTVIAALGATSMGFLGFLVFGPSLALLFLVNLAVLVAMVVLIYFWCQPGDPGSNAYGPPPPEFDPSKRVSPTP